MFCLYVRPRASGDPVGHPVLVGFGAAYDVVARGSGLVTFLGVGAGVAVVAMSNVVAMGPAVAIRVRSPPLVGVIAASSPAAAAPGLGRELVMEGLDLVGEVGVGGGKRGVRGNKLLVAFLLEAALARLSKALSMESRRPGLRVVEWAELARPR
jgi:hypothetical protein